MTIELLDTESDETEKCVSNAQTWNNYVECLTNPIASMPATSASRSSDSNNLAKIEIKTEKSDYDAVSA